MCIRDSLFLGFPLQHMQPLLDRTSEALLQDLAGNAMALPVLLAILVRTLASVSWRTGASAADAPASSTEEVTAALAMFDRLARTGPEKTRAHPMRRVVVWVRFRPGAFWMQTGARATTHRHVAAA